MSSGTLPQSVYHRAQSLGSGSYGSVLTVYNDDGEEFALKMFLDEDSEEESDSDDSYDSDYRYDDEEDSNKRKSLDLGTLREISILRLLREENRHRNVVEIHDIKLPAYDADDDEDYRGGAGIDASCVGLAMPMFHHGTLASAIDGRKFQNSQSEKVGIAHGILSAVAFLHANGILHRDIKGDNIMLALNEHNNDQATTYRPVLIDFSLAKLVTPAMMLSPNTDTAAQTDYWSLHGSTHTPDTGTPTYRSPEVVALQPYSLPSDIWSVGVVLLELLQNKLLLAQKDKHSFSYIEQARVLLDAKKDKPFANLIMNGLLVQKVDHRFTATQALQAPVFTKFGYTNNSHENSIKLVNIEKALPLDYGQDEMLLLQTSIGSKMKKPTINNKYKNKIQKRLDIIQKIGKELEVCHPFTLQAACVYSVQLSQLEEELNDLTLLSNNNQCLLDCVILAIKFFELDALNLKHLKRTTNYNSLFSNWSYEKYIDNESTIWMLMDYCLFPRQYIPNF